MLDLPSHHPECGSGLYPPRLLLTVTALDESQPPTTDLICNLEVRGTVEMCCFTLIMKYSAQGRDIQHAEIIWLVSIRWYECFFSECIQMPNQKRIQGQVVCTSKVQECHMRDLLHT